MDRLLSPLSEFGFRPSARPSPKSRLQTRPSGQPAPTSNKKRLADVVSLSISLSLCDKKSYRLDTSYIHARQTLSNHPLFFFRIGGGGCRIVRTAARSTTTFQEASRQITKYLVKKRRTLNFSSAPVIRNTKISIHFALPNYIRHATQYP